MQPRRTLWQLTACLLCWAGINKLLHRYIGFRPRLRGARGHSAAKLCRSKHLRSSTTGSHWQRQSAGDYGAAWDSKSEKRCSSGLHSYPHTHPGSHLGKHSSRGTYSRQHTYQYPGRHGTLKGWHAGKRRSTRSNDHCQHNTQGQPGEGKPQCSFLKESKSGGGHPY